MRKPPHAEREGYEQVQAIEVGINMETGEVKGHRHSVSPASRARALSAVLSREFRAGFRFYDAEQGEEVSLSEGEAALPPQRLPPEEVWQLACDGQARVNYRGDGTFQVRAVVYEGPQPVLVAEAWLPSVASDEAGRALEQERLQTWVQTFSDRLRLGEHLAAQRRAAQEQEDQARQAWAAVLGVTEAVRQVRFHKDLDRTRRKLLAAARGLLGCAAVVLAPESAPWPPLVEGEPLLSPGDCGHLGGLIARSNPKVRPGEIVVWTEEQAARWSSYFPRIVSLLAVPLADRPETGWLIALNKTGATDTTPCRRQDSSSLLSFRRGDAAVLLPFAGLLELHRRGTRRLQDLKDLLVGLTRSLTAAIDAKDSYTFGHSERVARIGLELGRELGLPEDDLSDLYLAGLLHDVGNIGIRETVLVKTAPLTAEEFEHVKEHVTIGYRILAGFLPLESLLPGVRSHHERYDGKGYPDGLAGEDIPLLARILAVADAYDAMSTRRPYREALSLAEVEKRLREGAGTHWDPRVIAAFLSRKERIHQIRQRGVGESLRQALDGTLRARHSSHPFPQPPLPCRAESSTEDPAPRLEVPGLQTG